MRLVVVSSSGGVLLDMLALRPWLNRHDVSWVAPLAPDTEVVLRDERVRWEPERDARALAHLPLDVVRAIRALRADKADCVVSAGTGIAVSWFVAARLLGIPRLWVDTFNFVDRPGRVARACGRLADVVLTQHPSPDPSRRHAIAVGLLY
jgi:hypothetical protein